MRDAKRVWIDLDNSPHVPFFRPIVDELRRAGYSVQLTARDAFQVAELVRLHGLHCDLIGRHYGKNPFKKVLGLLIRSLQLLPAVARNRPALAVSHGSRAQTIAAKLLGIPTVVIADYEHVTHVARVDCFIVPEVIASERVNGLAHRVLKYPGIKEDVYAAGFRPQPSIRPALGIDDAKVLVIVRPPATEAHYHNPQSEKLFSAVMTRLSEVEHVQIVLLPRTDRQKAEVVARWPNSLVQRKIVIPDHAVDGLNLIWYADLVISGGGTMNREAAALGVPVYTIFRGTIGAVDRYLVEHGRLVLIESTRDVREKIALTKRERPVEYALGNRAALDSVVGSLVSLMNPR